MWCTYLKQISFTSFERNLHIRYRQVSHYFFGIFLDLFFNIKDSYVFATHVGLQLDISSFEGFNILIEGFKVLNVFQLLHCFLLLCFQCLLNILVPLLVQLFFSILISLQIARSLSSYMHELTMDLVINHHDSFH